eukprot:6491445-Amphidinium_carterae.1
MEPSRRTASRSTPKRCSSGPSTKHTPYLGPSTPELKKAASPAASLGEAVLLNPRSSAELRRDLAAQTRM